MGNNPTTPEKGEIKVIKEKREKAPGKEATKRELVERIEELETKLSAEHERAETYLRQLIYARADVENLRKNLEKQVEDIKKLGNERIIRDLLIVLDELELSVRSGEKTSREDLLSGVEMVLKKFEKILEKQGLKPIEAFDRLFDPALHEAFMKAEVEDKPEGTIVQELKRGYTLGGKVIRPSMVKVSVKPKVVRIKGE